jgi:methylmalonyl-CoA mutase
MEKQESLQDLFSSFSPADLKEWNRVATQECEGKDPMETLRWNSHEISGLPIYNRENFDSKNHASPFQLEVSSEFNGPRSWINMPVVKVLEAHEANSIAFHHLQRGADGIYFQLKDTEAVSIEKLLKNIEWKHCFIAFQIPSITDSFSDHLIQFLKSYKEDPTSINGFLLTETYPHHPQSLHKVIHTLQVYPRLRLLGITSSHNQPIDQISDMLHKAVTILEYFNDTSSHIESWVRNIFFSVDIGTDLFIEIAKLKALRILWKEVVHAYGIKSYSASDLLIHAQSKSWKNAAYDPHENMLKSTTASLAAILGGCPVLSVYPEHENDERESRIARNVSNILREESHINKVADPTAGSFYLESLTRTLANESWKKFKSSLA